MDSVLLLCNNSNGPLQWRLRLQNQQPLLHEHSKNSLHAWITWLACVAPMSISLRIMVKSAWPATPLLCHRSQINLLYLPLLFYIIEHKQICLTCHSSFMSPSTNKSVWPAAPLLWNWAQTDLYTDLEISERVGHNFTFRTQPSTWVLGSDTTCRYLQPI